MSSEVKGHFRRDGTYVSPHTRRNNNPGRATEKARDVKGQLGDFSPTSYQEPEPLTGTHAYHNILKDVRAGQVRRGDINDLHEEISDLYHQEGSISAWEADEGHKALYDLELCYNSGFNNPVEMEAAYDSAAGGVVAEQGNSIWVPDLPSDSKHEVPPGYSTIRQSCATVIDGTDGDVGRVKHAMKEFDRRMLYAYPDYASGYAVKSN